MANIERAFTSRSLLGFQQPTNLSTTTTHRYLSTMVQRQLSPKCQKLNASTEPTLMVMSVNIEGLSSANQQILAKLCAYHNCDVLCMHENHRGPGALRPGIHLVAEIAHEQYGSALFIRDSCTCESTSTSITDNIELIQATLNGVSVNSYYKPPNQAFDFRSSTTYTHLQVIICDFNSHSTECGYRSTNDDSTLMER